jgi:hypothetical protein
MQTDLNFTVKSYRVDTLSVEVPVMASPGMARTRVAEAAGALGVIPIMSRIREGYTAHPVVVGHTPHPDCKAEHNVQVEWVTDWTVPAVRDVKPEHRETVERLWGSRLFTGPVPRVVNVPVIL